MNHSPLQAFGKKLPREEIDREYVHLSSDYLDSGPCHHKCKSPYCDFHTVRGTSLFCTHHCREQKTFQLHVIIEQEAKMKRGLLKPTAQGMEICQVYGEGVDM